jgi:hypothetical protein
VAELFFWLWLRCVVPSRQFIFLPGTLVRIYLFTLFFARKILVTIQQLNSYLTFLFVLPKMIVGRNWSGSVGKPIQVKNGWRQRKPRHRRRLRDRLG